MDKIPQLLGHYKDTQYLMLPKKESCFPVSLVGARPCLSLCARREPSPLLYTSGGQGRLQDSAWLMRCFCHSHHVGGIVFSSENLRIQRGWLWASRWPLGQGLGGEQTTCGSGPALLAGSQRTPTVWDALQMHQSCASAALGICTTTPSQTFSQSPFLL